MHKIKYLPLALKDLRDITDYIIGTLKAPKAALELVDALDNSISRLQQFPYSCKVYQPMQSLEAEYRILPVKNYLVFYVVSEYDAEIHRIIYARMNLEKIIK
jgi:addiction module RelE/StbE family toxin